MNKLLYLLVAFAFGMAIAAGLGHMPVKDGMKPLQYRGTRAAGLSRDKTGASSQRAMSVISNPNLRMSHART